MLFEALCGSNVKRPTLEIWHSEFSLECSKRCGSNKHFRQDFTAPIILLFVDVPVFKILCFLNNFIQQHYLLIVSCLFRLLFFDSDSPEVIFILSVSSNPENISRPKQPITQ